MRAKEIVAMADCKLANGQTLSAEDIERECAEYESGTWDGRLDCIPVGPAAIADEPLVTVTVKFPASMIAAVDERSSDRFDYIRRAVAAAIFADACEMAAEWLQGECEYRAIHDEPFPKQTFGNQPKNGGKVVIVAVNADKGTVRKVNASRAAEMLGVTKGRVSQMVKANQLEAFRDGGTVWVTLDSIEARLVEKPKAGRPAKAQATA